MQLPGVQQAERSAHPRLQQRLGVRIGFGRAARVIAGLAALLALVLAADLLAFDLRSTTMFRLDVGSWGDQNLLRGVYDQETDAAGATYRWTDGSSTFFVRDFAVAPTPRLRIDIGGLPPGAGDKQLVVFAIDRTPLLVPIQSTPRQYFLLPPSGALLDGDLDLQMTSPTSITPPDPRALAFRLNDITLGWPSDAWSLPTLPMLLAQTAIVVVWLLIAWRLEAPRRALPLVAALAIALLAWMTSYQLMMAMAWHTRALATSLVVLALAWRSYDRLERWFPRWGSRSEWRWVGWLTAIAIGVRLLVIFYPPWGSHDLYIHERRLADVQIGSIQLFDTPSEFGSNRTIVPPAFYVLVLPLTLLTNDPSAAIHGLYAMLEGTTPLLVALLIHQLGGSNRAALLAGVLAACLPIQLTILWWGFGPQVVSQWLLLLLLVLLTRPAIADRAAWFFGGLVLTLALLTHNGAVVLGGALLGSYIAWMIIRERGDRAIWWRWAGVFAAGSAIALLLVYGEVVVSQLTGARSSAATPPLDGAEEAARIGRVWAGLQSSFRPLGLALSALGFGALLITTRNRPLVLAWIGSGLLFLLVDLLWGLQVRYAYFVVPLLCGGVGLVLDWLLARRAWGRIAAVAIVGYVALVGLNLWFESVFLGIKPTLTALTH